MSFRKIITGNTVRTVVMLMLIVPISVSAAGSFDNTLSDPHLIWNGWMIPANNFGNPECRYISSDEWEELLELGEIAEQNTSIRNTWKIIYCLADSTDAIRVGPDGVLHFENAALNEKQRNFCLKAFERFKQCVFAYSGGNMMIESIRRDLEGPFRSKYKDTTFFWPKDHMDLGEGIDAREYDSVIGHFYPGPVRTPFAGGTVDSDSWCRGSGHSSVILDPSQETGGLISVMAKRTLHEWLQQIGFLYERNGYEGMPDLSSLAAYARNPAKYFMQFIVTPDQWRSMSMHGEPVRAANKPINPDRGFLREWLVSGPFFTRETSAFETSFFNEKTLAPMESEITIGREWLTLLSQSGEVQLGIASPVSRKNAVIFAHTYVFAGCDTKARLWMGCSAPFSVRLNGNEGIRVWEGTAKDTVVRDVLLKEGWNRLLVKVLQQDQIGGPSFTAKFTRPDGSELPELDCSTQKPGEQLVEPQENAFGPITPTYYSLEDVKSDIWGKLPVISEQHLEAFIGQKGIRIRSEADGDYLFLDVSRLKGIQSRVLDEVDDGDYSLNNELNFTRESAAILRYTGHDGILHDMLFVEPDMLNPFVELLSESCKDESLAPQNRILGYVLRNRKLAVVIDTSLGSLPLNEFDMLHAKDGDFFIETRLDTNVAIRGQDVKVTFTIENTGENIIDIATLFLAGFPDGQVKKVGTVYNFIRNERHFLSYRLLTAQLGPGPIILNAVMKYEIADDKRTLTMPLPIDLHDPVNIELIPEHTALQTKREFDILLKLRNNMGKPAKGTVKLKLPGKWKAKPSSYTFKLGGGDSETVKIKVKIPEIAADGKYTIMATTKIKGGRSADATAQLVVYKSFSPRLVQYSFDKGISGDFALTDGNYKVNLSRDGPFSGPACLKIEDEGGSHYGHVWMFTHEIFNSTGSDGMRYSYDTQDYPIIDFRLRTEAVGPDLGIHVLLDDGEEGYGIVLNGEWDGTLSSGRMIGRADFTPDGKWQHVVIDLDNYLDEFLGDIPHRVLNINFGNTRNMDFGWWTDIDKQEYFIDGFSIRK